MTRRCKYPSCRTPATHSWALVPVCRAHFVVILTETVKYYSGRNVKRPEYEKIRRLTPWKGGKPG